MSTHPQDLRKRSYGYSLRAIELYQALQKVEGGAGWVLGKQYLRAAISIGVNVEEAQSAASPPDFVQKYGIAQKEAKHSIYWLKLLAESGTISLQRLRPLMKETEELFAVITGIILSAKKGSVKGKG